MSYQIHADPAARAESMGLKMFVRPANVLMIDADVPVVNAMTEVRRQFEKLFEDPLDVGQPGLLVTQSKSGRAHIYIALNKPMLEVEAIALQLFLGSDPKREYLSLNASTFGSNYPVTVLFETPAEAERVEKWLKEVTNV